MKRTKAVAIPKEVKESVWERDGERCIFCRRWVTVHCANAHVINRSQGGLGIVQNIITACPDCHRELDNGVLAKMYRDRAIEYMREQYEGWTRDSVTYKKGEI